MTRRLTILFFTGLFFLILPKNVHAVGCSGYQANVTGYRVELVATSCQTGEEVRYFVNIGDFAHNISLQWNRNRVQNNFLGSTSIARPGDYVATFYGYTVTYSVNPDTGLTTQTRSENEKIGEARFTIEEVEIDMGEDNSQDPGPNPRQVLCDGTSSCIKTGLGNIRFDDNETLAARLANYGVALGGSIALILIVIAAYRIMTSQGDPRRLTGAKELLAAAISGLLMLIFSAYILRFLGVEILGLF